MAYRPAPKAPPQPVRRAAPAPVQPKVDPLDPPRPAQLPEPPQADEPHEPESAPFQTIADEQRARSAEIARMGPAAYMAQFDTRDPADKGVPVPGVGTAGDAKSVEGTWTSSSRSTPEARSYQNRAAP